MTRFTLDGAEVEAAPGETIWQVATRQGIEVPHLCHLERPGYRPDGNCRACLVQIEGERVLGASCIRKPAEGMVVRTATERVQQARRMVFELLLADQPGAASRDPSGIFARWARHLGVQGSRFAPEPAAPQADPSHPAMLVQLDACIQCGLCERACREVQHNDVIGLAGRGIGVTVSFDTLTPMGESTCVACGECVQACPPALCCPRRWWTRRGCAHRNRSASSPPSAPIAASAARWISTSATTQSWRSPAATAPPTRAASA
jgi:formate dehydrogenase major subunit